MYDQRLKVFRYNFIQISAEWNADQLALFDPTGPRDLLSPQP